MCRGHRWGRMVQLAWCAVAAIASWSSPSHGDDPTPGARQPLTLPLTPGERRWLIDRHEGQRFQSEDPEEAKSNGKWTADAPLMELPPNLRQIQRSLGGPVVDQFTTLAEPEPDASGTLRPELAPGPVPDPAMPELATDPAPLEDRPALPGAWTPDRPGDAPPTHGAGDQNYADPRGGSKFAMPQVAPAEGQGLGDTSRTRIVALRHAAAELDVAANRLELLELYRQADDLRQQAQRLRVDARTMLGYREPAASTSGVDQEAPSWDAPVILEEPRDDPPQPRIFGSSGEPAPLESAVPTDAPK